MATRPRTPGSGRKQGTRDKVPGGRKARASIVAMIQELVADPAVATRIKAAIRRKLQRADKDLTKLAAEHLDGKPLQKIQVTDPQPITIVVNPPADDDEDDG